MPCHVIKASIKPPKNRVQRPSGLVNTRRCRESGTPGRKHRFYKAITHSISKGSHKNLTRFKVRNQRLYLGEWQGSRRAWKYCYNHFGKIHCAIYAYQKTRALSFFQVVVQAPNQNIILGLCLLFSQSHSINQKILSTQTHTHAAR